MFKKTFRLLCLGNSFSEDATKYLYDIVKLFNYDEIIIANLYIGGASLELHHHNITNNLEAYDFWTNTNGVWNNKGKKSYNDCLNNEWDFITFQQASPLSGKSDSYQPYLNDIIKFTLDNVKKETKLYWHQTWAYQKDSKHPDFSNYNHNQLQMFMEILDTTRNEIEILDTLSGIIYNNVVIQSLRQTSLQDNVTIDGHHLNRFGRLAAALNMFYTLTNTNISNINFKHYDFSIKDVELITEIFK